MSICPACQREFTCGVTDGDGARCWCMDLPPLALDLSYDTADKTAVAACYCLQCLQQKRLERAGAAEPGRPAELARKKE